MTDHERIWLEPECCVDPDIGRQWCEDPDVWIHYCGEDELLTDSVEYVRADLYAELEAAYKHTVEDNMDLVRQLDAVKPLYIAINEMLAVIGAEGEIDSLHEKTTAVMDAMYDLDKGVYDVDRFMSALHQVLE